MKSESKRWTEVSKYMWWSKIYSICAVVWKYWVTGHGNAEVTEKHLKMYSTWVNALSYIPSLVVWFWTKHLNLNHLVCSPNKNSHRESNEWWRVWELTQPSVFPQFPFSREAFVPVILMLKEPHVKFKGLWKLIFIRGPLSVDGHVCTTDLLSWRTHKSKHRRFVSVGASKLSIATAVIQVIRGISRPNTKKK